MLTQLCPAEHLGKSNIKEFHGRLGIMIGQWSAEQARLDISPLVKTFRAMRRNLQRITAILSGRDEGIRESHDMEVVSHLTSLLALNPEVGSRGQGNKLISAFRDADKLGHACLIAAFELEQQAVPSTRHVGVLMDGQFRGFSDIWNVIQSTAS